MLDLVKKSLGGQMVRNLQVKSALQRRGDELARGILKSDRVVWVVDKTRVLRYGLVLFLVLGGGLSIVLPLIFYFVR